MTDNKHHEQGSPEATKHDPHKQYPEGVICFPDEVFRGKYNGLPVLAVRAGTRWANVHPIDGVAAYGIRWWLGQYEVDDLGLKKGDEE